MTYRDEHGHFISEAEARRRGLIEEEVEEEASSVPEEFGASARGGARVPVDVGRGSVVNVPAGSPFFETIERLADEANYGGFYRVYLNSSEIPEPSSAPATIEPGMRIAITSYDKVG